METPTMPPKSNKLQWFLLAAVIASIGVVALASVHRWMSVGTGVYSEALHESVVKKVCPDGTLVLQKGDAFFVLRPGFHFHAWVAIDGGNVC
jgi:hypothetical protein